MTLDLSAKFLEFTSELSLLRSSQRDPHSWLSAGSGGSLLHRSRRSEDGEAGLGSSQRRLNLNGVGRPAGKARGEEYTQQGNFPIHREAETEPLVNKESLENESWLAINR